MWGKPRRIQAEGVLWAKRLREVSFPEVSFPSNLFRVLFGFTPQIRSVTTVDKIRGVDVVAIHKPALMQTSLSQSPPPTPSGCPDHAHVPPCSTEIPIPDDGTTLLQISAVLQQLCDHNSDLRAKCLTIFDSVAKPTMSIHHYCAHPPLHRYPYPPTLS